jgi:ABC-2 type transport system ATP-binding protein
VTAIVTRHLSKTYKGLGKGGKRSLDDLDLEIGAGEVFGFLGRNGAGKTTTIKILCGLLKASSGEAEIFGKDVRSREARAAIGYLPEQPYFYEYLTPRETIEFYGRLRGLSAPERESTWDRLSTVLDLRNIAGQRIKSFSKGMRQRVGFAVALVGDPPLLILDEPMSGLDPVGRRNTRELILRCREEGKTIFFSSHVLSDVELICDRIGILVQGKLTRYGRIDELLGGHVDQMELVARGAPAALAETLSSSALQHHRLEELDIFVLKDAEAANTAIRLLQAAGAEAVSLNPIKVRLEDYFMQEQARHETPAREEA